jgi:hypothetical protein
LYRVAEIAMVALTPEVARTSNARMTFSRTLLGLSLFLLVPALAACGGSDETTKSTGGTTTSGTGGGGTGGGGGAGTGAGGAGTGGGGDVTPIDAPKETWTYVPFDDAFCGNGEPTGIGINPSDKSKNLVFFLMGGGACWDNLTCFVAKTATNIESGYGPANFDSDVKSMLSSSLFDRNAADNPFKDASFVFIPYCTGDVHAGDNVADYSGKKVHHVGRANFQKYLARIQATFPDADHVLVSGSSAGGYGAGFNFWRVKKAFANAKIDLVDDSGPPLPPPYLAEDLEQKWRMQWNLAEAFPPDCAGCKDDFDALFTYYGTTFTDSRMSLLSYDQDQVISFFFNVPQKDMPAALDALATKAIDPYPQMKYYYVTGNSHTMLGNTSGVTQNGVVLQDWLTQQWTGAAEWASVKP